MENINRISKNLRERGYISSPHQCAEDHAILAGEYAWVMGQLELILQRKPGIWSEMRKNFKSDTSCERGWESTEDGINEAGLRLRAKAIERMMSALKSIMRLAETEINNSV